MINERQARSCVCLFSIPPPFFSLSSHTFTHRLNYTDLLTPLLHCFPATSIFLLLQARRYLKQGWYICLAPRWPALSSVALHLHIYRQAHKYRENVHFYKSSMYIDLFVFYVFSVYPVSCKVCERKRKCGTKSCVLRWSCSTLAYLIFCKL